eukprot:403350925
MQATNFSRRFFSKRYFKVSYDYVEDAYYKRIPHRENHLKNLEALKAQNQTKLISVPFFPFDGNVMFIETEGDKSYVENCIKNDPYIKNKIVEKFDIQEVEMTAQQRFERISSNFLMRS